MHRFFHILNYYEILLPVCGRYAGNVRNLLGKPQTVGSYLKSLPATPETTAEYNFRFAVDILKTFETQ